MSLSLRFYVSRHHRISQQLLKRTFCVESSSRIPRSEENDTFSTHNVETEAPTTSTHKNNVEDSVPFYRNRPGIQPLETPVGTFNKQQVIPNEIHVSHLPQDISRSELAQHFGRFGEITALTLTSTGIQEKNIYAVIRFKDIRSCDAALSLDGKLLGTKTLSVRRNMNALFLARMHERLRTIRRRSRESNE
ncbi:hypothetical protein Gasu2_64330 [Galdieria sulphuraria]|uniref:RRM domain-containing protein n=1 Tax=Galdieria sulphuraria TaxID=130081 RepID=M2XSN5_GALSU|nr:uncharacterized protein Gasu_59100 [Galdieria sulphuraria]EME26419.1 hypothetical protein Gasu_59100 [Galdieria sulphuraria]GJD12342.1 hypothetical protein Gasu2_64330 [Galdieria sulphuraria]|eukprot:XP_005702939.1 hypothetical protein Gasu_59100 [Galdieria sulphuraria]